jgi:hypothetical protein
MSASDTTVPFSLIDGAIVITDGSTNSFTVGLVKAQIQYEVEGEKWEEATHNGQHLSTPTARKVGDGRVTGSFEALVATMKGSSDESLYEVVTGPPSGWVTTGAGDRKMVKITFTGTNSTGATQSIAFNYCIFEKSKLTWGGANGLTMIACSFTDLENRPTIT